MYTIGQQNEQFMIKEDGIIKNFWWVTGLVDSWSEYCVYYWSIRLCQDPKTSQSYKQFS